MGTFAKTAPLAGAILLAASLFGGCGPKSGAVRADGPGMAVRVPPMEVMDVRLRPDGREAPPEPPFSVADETKGRWLTLFEVTASPVSAGNLPERDEPGE